MPVKKIQQTTMLDCKPDVAYNAWLDSKQHGLMTGGHESDAVIDPSIGGEFNIWDGAAVGKTIELEPELHKITQEWRYDYDDWPSDEPSILTIQFLASGDGCEVHFSQSDLPEKYADDVARGWETYYWLPMKNYFSKTK